jgi:hypothetical protein
MTLTVPEVLGILALVLATAKFLASRLDSIKVDNTAAHAAITDNVKAITENVKENQRQIASLGARVDAIAVDVAFLRGRQQARDRADQAAGG